MVLKVNWKKNNWILILNKVILKKMIKSPIPTKPVVTHNAYECMNHRGTSWMNVYVNVILKMVIGNVYY